MFTFKSKVRGADCDYRVFVTSDSVAYLFDPIADELHVMGSLESALDYAEYPTSCPFDTIGSVEAEEFAGWWGIDGASDLVASFILPTGDAFVIVELIDGTESDHYFNLDGSVF